MDFNLPHSIACRLSSNGSRRSVPDLPLVFIHVGTILVIHLTRIEPLRKCEPSRMTSKPKTVVTKPC